MRLRDGSTTSHPSLDRLVQFDEHSRAYRAVDRLGVDQRVPRSRTWRVNAHLDQRNTDGCVGFTFMHEAIGSPRAIPRYRGLSVPQMEAVAHDGIYHVAQHIDPWSGCYLGRSCPTNPSSSAPYGGTSMLAGAKAARSLGHFREYRWVFSEEEAWLTLAHLGPVLIGVNWYEGMMDTDDKGFITPSGRSLGGHATYLFRSRVRTKRRDTEWYEGWNSWGRAWGEGGIFRISRPDLARLLAEDGEGLIVSQR